MKGSNPILLKPEMIPATPLPTQYLEVFEALDKTVESTLGAGMPSLDETNMSGKALYNLTQFISASNEQFMQHLEQSVTQLGQVILEAMPAVLDKETFTIKSGDEEYEKEFDFMFDHEMMNIVINRGVDNKLQQQATIEMLMDFAKENQTFAQFLNTPDGVTLILKNVDMNDKEKVMKAWGEYAMKLKGNQQEMTQEQQMEQQKNAQLAQIEAEKVQAQMITAQAKLKKIELEAMEVGLDQKNSEHTRDLEYHKIKSANTRNILDNQSKLAQTHMEYKKHLIDTLEEQDGAYNK